MIIWGSLILGKFRDGIDSFAFHPSDLDGAEVIEIAADGGLGRRNPLVGQQSDQSLLAGNWVRSQQPGHQVLALVLRQPHRFDPGPARRRRWMIGFTLLMAALFAIFAVTHTTVIDVLDAIVIGLLSASIVLQYADVRAAYPAELTGRAMALFTMAMFMGVALMQWFTGFVATLATAHGMETYAAVLGTIAALLAAGALAFAVLPGPVKQH